MRACLDLGRRPGDLPVRPRALLPIVLAILVAVGARTADPRAGTVHAAGYVAPGCTLAAPTPGTPSACTWQGITLQSPDTQSSVATPTSPATCSPSTLADCEDVPVTVPSGVSPSTLYVKVGWTHPSWQVFMYVIDPSGTVHGTAGLGCDASSFNKGCGNQTTLPFDELVVANPAAGKWTVRVAGVNIHNEAYTGQVALTKSNPLQSVAASLTQLTAALTRTQPVNIVFAGWKPTSSELADMVANLTTTFLPSVAEKQFCDGGDNNDSQGSGLIQHGTAHCTATAAPTDSAYNAAGSVPYFEPLRFNMDYHFLAADDTWTKDLFGVMKGATTQDHLLSSGRIPETPETAPFKAGYLAAYAPTAAADSGPTVSDTTHVDEIDGNPVEDWIQGTRFSSRYQASFTDLVSGKKTSGAFINPDPNASRDPFWNANGTQPQNVNRDPQGDNTGLTFFLLDTWEPSYAKDYFRTDHFHYWWTADHVTDPDAGGAAFTDNGRGWGGRYRFSILDLGAAPTTYERANWVSTSIAPDGGSAAFDPPIWDYRNSPLWNGSLPPVAQTGNVPVQAGGNTLGQVMGWEITQGLAFKYVGAYLYRPIPNDVYILATTQVVDHYSLPSEGDLYSVDMTKVDRVQYAQQQLSSAAPYASFLAGSNQAITLGCATNHTVVGDVQTPLGQQTPAFTQQVLDPSCVGKTSDPFQDAIEYGKATGTQEVLTAGAAAPTYAVNQHAIRNFIDKNRPTYAPLSLGAFTVPVVNIMFEHDWNVALPLLVGGIAENVNGGEGWGQFDNVNDVLVPAQAIDCSKSSTVPPAPGCNGVPDTFRHDYGLTYTMIHESSHFLGLPHPHDGTASVQKDGTGKWDYYYSMLKWLYDVSASPTTYAGTYSVYENIDQGRLMYGHAAEYLKQAQDYLADAVFQDGARGATSPSDLTLRKQSAMRADISQGSALFQCGDYLHAQYAMKNASLHAKGVVQAPVAPHKLTQQEAATDTNAVFAIDPAPYYGSDSRCASSAPSSTPPVTAASAGDSTGQPALVNTSAGGAANLGGVAAAWPLAILGVLGLAARRRRRS
jgi:hypothetical protein